MRRGGGADRRRKGDVEEAQKRQRLERRCRKEAEERPGWRGEGRG